MGLKIKIVNVSSVTSRLYVSDIGERDVIKDLLNKKDVEYYTYSTRGEKPISLLLKGLHDSTEEEDLVEEIKRLLPKIEDIVIKRYVTDKSRREGYSLSSFLLKAGPIARRKLRPAGAPSKLQRMPCL